MLVTLYFWPLLGLRLTYAATINVISASDPSILYSPGWSQEFSQSTQDSFMEADGFECALSVTLPRNASSVSYVGFQRAGGSMYGYTLDCETDCILQTANGSDPTITDDASVPQSTLFTIALDPSTQHTLYVYNIPSDQPDGSSQINLNNLNVDVSQSGTVVAGPGPTQSVSDTAKSPPSASASASSSLVSAQTSTLATSTSPSRSASATSSPSISVSASNGGVSSSSATKISSTRTESSTSSATGSETPSIPVLPITPSSSTGGHGSTNAGSSNGSGKTSGLSKSVAIGVSVLAVVIGGVVIAALVVFLRQRRKKRNSYPETSSASQPPLSPTGSIIPIMPPPQMRHVSTDSVYAIPNPFMDPPSEPPSFEIPFNTALMQRRMEGRGPGSPASPAPNIPLPSIPLDSRNNSPVGGYARSDLWITRSPAKASFSVV